ncbi:kinase-like domain-containing protein [Suillus subalutaceus]|uniref:kinase-like domain-containing protein n=1 Tax=Suillus subalutaceus TaxID=48586 RepID=UPI001B8684DC|nr:kinase-like domain-containing protein [Suillus subalutaceus]KAG1871379.1 kinase-like domain-containing protein [Suillus subalutaceus]
MNGGLSWLEATQADFEITGTSFLKSRSWLDSLLELLYSRLKLGDVVGSGSYGGVGIPHALWFGREAAYHALVLDLLGPSLQDLFLAHNQKFNLHTVVHLGDQLLSRLKYIHAHNYVHGDIKPQNVLVGLGHLRHTAYIIDFGIAKEYWNTTTRVHIPFRQNQSLTGTPVFASINNHLGLTSDHEKLSSSSILERKVNTTIEVLCDGIPVEFASILIYTRSLAFSEDPDYGHLRSLLHSLQATLSAPATCSLNFSQPDDHIIHPPPISNEHWIAEAAPPLACPPDATPLWQIDSCGRSLRLLPRLLLLLHLSLFPTAAAHIIAAPTTTAHVAAAPITAAPLAATPIATAPIAIAVALNATMLQHPHRQQQLPLRFCDDNPAHTGTSRTADDREYIEISNVSGDEEG